MNQYSIGVGNGVDMDGRRNKIAEENRYYNDMLMVAKLEIPKIDVDDIVVEGTGNVFISTTLGHFSETQQPGEVGNFAIAGHRGGKYGTFFKYLPELEIGDEIKVTKLAERMLRPNVISKEKMSEFGVNVDNLDNLDNLEDLENLNDLDTLAQELLELAQTRGGDQVISRIVGQDAVFYGGSTEARENKSKVKVRAIANSLKELILKSSNVIISGHIDTDADSLGAALCISAIAKKLGKEAYIIFDKERAESTILYALDKYADEINERHNIIPEEEGTPLLNNDSLVIMVDHHLSEQSCAKHILKAAKNIVIEIKSIKNDKIAIKYAAIKAKTPAIIENVICCFLFFGEFSRKTNLIFTFQPTSLLSLQQHQFYYLKF